MSLSESPPTCAGCKRSLDPADRFCRHCGRRTGRTDDRFYRPGWILLLSFLVLGPLALGLVWKSPYLTQRGRIGFTVLILLYFALVIAFALWLCIFTWSWFQESMAYY